MVKYSEFVRRSVLPIALAAAFGALDQFLRARAWFIGSWATDVSLLSAPWLLVAFAAGWSQRTVVRAIVLGFVCTMAALAGYWAMTLSPIEGAELTAQGVFGLLLGQSVYATGAGLTGPLFGWFGYRWRTRRDLASAFAAALAVCLEPLAHAVAGTPVSFNGVWAAEVGAGLTLALYVVAASRRSTTR